MRRRCAILKLLLAVASVWLFYNMKQHMGEQITNTNSSSPFYRDALWKTTENKGVVQIHHYDVKDVTLCFDELPSRNLQTSPSDDQVAKNRSQLLSLVFMGDSRMRQQFYTFVQLLPDYDLIWTRPPGDLQVLMSSCHCNMSVRSPLLNVEVAFAWRPIIDDALINEIEQWPYSTPLFIIIGINAHHLLSKNNVAHPVYTHRLEKLSRSLKRLVEFTQVIWMISQPILDDARGNYNLTKFTFDVHSAKVLSYNKLTRLILKDSGVEFLDSTEAEAFDYLRACSMIKRDGDSAFFQCTDRVHLGHVVIHQTTQILLNYLCNKVV